MWDLSGLPAGQWVASYSLVVLTTSPIQCFFRQASPVTGQAFTAVPTPSGLVSLNATAVIDTTGSHGPVQLHCQGGAAYTIYTTAHDVESSVSFTNLTSVSEQPIAPAAPRPAPGQGGRVTGGR